MNTYWPYYQQPANNYTVAIGYPTLEQIREVVREEVHKALHPEEERPSATVEYAHDGQIWRGTVYLVEDEDETEEEE